MHAAPLTRRLVASVLVCAATLAGVVAPADAARASACAALSLRQRVTQTVASSIPGSSLNSASAAIAARWAGAVVLFGDNLRDADQTQRLTTMLRRRAPLRLLVAVDEEGGRVARLGEKGIVAHLPAARTMAATLTTRQVRRLARRVGGQMHDVGVNWNLAPVLDVAGAPSGTVIGDRAFSSRASTVARYGRAFARGLQRAGVRTTGKHFPGHGRTTVDSHASLPVVRASRRQLWRRDVAPYRAAAANLDAIMSAHVVYTAVDKRRPGSLSRHVTRLLRRKVGYEGLLVTDALEMGAISGSIGAPKAAVRALRAGADMVVTGVTWRAAPAIVRRLHAAVRAGRIPQPRLDQAVGRVLHAKGYADRRVACMLR